MVIIWSWRKKIENEWIEPLPANHALIEITEKNRKALDSGKFAFGIFVDLQKAFDTVNHDILLTKLEHYGLRGTSKLSR